MTLVSRVYGIRLTIVLGWIKVPVCRKAAVEKALLRVRAADPIVSNHRMSLKAKYEVSLIFYSWGKKRFALYKLTS